MADVTRPAAPVSEAVASRLREAAAHFAYMQVDAAYASGQQLRRWLDKAPEIEDRWALARILSSEMRCAWQMCHVLYALDRADLVEELLWRKRGDRAIECLNMDLETWPDALASLFYIGGITKYYLEDAGESSHATLARVVAPLLRDDHIRRTFALNRITRFVATGTEREAFQRVTDKWYPRALDAFGRTGSRTDREAVDLGLRRTSSVGLRARYIADRARDAEPWGITLPDALVDRHVL